MSLCIDSSMIPLPSGRVSPKTSEHAQVIDINPFEDYSTIVGTAKLVDQVAHPRIYKLIERLETAKTTIEGLNKSSPTVYAEIAQKDFLLTTWTEEYSRVKHDLQQEIQEPMGPLFPTQQSRRTTLEPFPEDITQVEDVTEEREESLFETIGRIFDEIIGAIVIILLGIRFKIQDIYEDFRNPEPLFTEENAILIADKEQLSTIARVITS